MQATKQLNVPAGETQPMACEDCGFDIFDQGFRVRKMSKMSPHNPTGQDMVAPMPVFICMACGHELGQPSPIEEARKAEQRTGEAPDPGPGALVIG